MSDPWGRMGGMIETYATATDFRRYLAQIANCVGYRQDRCVIMRHGQEIAALVSYEDLEFLRKYKPRKMGPPAVDVCSPKAAWQDHFPEPPVPQPAPPPEPGAPGVVVLVDPWEMPLEQVRACYDALQNDPDPDVWDWISRAANRLSAERLRMSGAGPPSG